MGKKKIKELFISTTDRKSLASCLRKFDLSSFLRQSLTPKEQAIPLWFGNMFHFVLEDHYGYKNYDSHQDAINDYISATKKYYGVKQIPANYVELGELCLQMVNYYLDDWNKEFKNKNYETLYFEGKPLVELAFKIRLKIPKKLQKKLCKQYKVDKVKVYYKGIIDRVVKDKEGFIYLLDYKTCKQFISYKSICIDKQVGAYLWAIPFIPELSQFTILGFIYQQHRKSLPVKPLVLQNGEMSLSYSQNTTAKLIKQQATELYGKPKNWSLPVKQFYKYYLNKYPFYTKGNNFITQTIVNKTIVQRSLEEKDFMNEVCTMLDPDLLIYRSASYNCTNICSFTEVCIAMNSSEKRAKQILLKEFKDNSYMKRSDWAKHLKNTKYASKEE